MKSLVKHTILALVLTVLGLQPAQAGQKLDQEDRVALQLALMAFVDSKTFDG